jgi:glutamate formiminotransferase/formiminotetrahydrofolate cyclodeaminase
VIRLVECVPNFSEGRNRDVIDRICAEAADVEGVLVLDVDPGAATNRTVVTLAGPPDAVAEAAFRAIARAAELIDMARHSGAHPRMGATDVCPFVPIEGVTMEECSDLARKVGRRVGEELQIPVFLYEEAASTEERRSLAVIRQGEYEGLAERLGDPRWRPDFGPAKHNPRSGATAIGAREFLIAYNIDLNTRDKRLAHEIALNIREAGRAKRDPAGEIVRDAEGKAVKVPGALQHVRGVGWFIDEYGKAQVSVNLTNYRITPPHVAFEECCREADRLGLRVTGSEIVGLVPLEAMLMAGRYYRKKQGKSPAVPERDLVELAVHSLGLNDVAPFDPELKIVENRFGARGGGFAGATVAGFIDDVARDTPAPGGGSVAALCGSLAAGLAAMVAGITYPRKDAEAHREDLERIGAGAQALRGRLLHAIQADSDAFNAMMAARRIRAVGPEESAAKEKAILAATIGAIEVPISVVAGAAEVAGLADALVGIGAPSALSDVGVAALAAHAAAEGAFDNVLTNLADLSDASAAAELRRRAEAHLSEAAMRAKRVRDRVNVALRSRPA